MTKQEFLAISLPYGLKVYDCIGNSIELVDYSKGCPKCVCEAIGQVKNEDKCVNVFQAAYDKQLKPILRNISDLTKEIEHKGEKFVPLYKLFQPPVDIEDCSFTNERKSYRLYVPVGSDVLKYDVNKDCDVNNFWIIQKLIEWKFAVGLNESEYIDVNTLSENPYK